MQDMSDLRKSIAERLGSAGKVKSARIDSSMLDGSMREVPIILKDGSHAVARKSASGWKVDGHADIPAFAKLRDLVAHMDKMGFSRPGAKAKFGFGVGEAFEFEGKVYVVNSNADTISSLLSSAKSNSEKAMMLAAYMHKGWISYEGKRTASRPGVKAKFDLYSNLKAKQAKWIRQAQIAMQNDNEEDEQFSSDMANAFEAVSAAIRSQPMSQVMQLVKTFRSEAQAEIATVLRSSFSRPGAKAKFSMQFEVGKTYEHSFANDSDSRVMWKVMARSGSMLTIKQVASGYRVKTNDPSDYRHGVSAVNGETKRVKIHSDERGEYVYPMGRYSMAPSIRATDIARGFSRPGAKAKMGKWESTLTKKDGKPMEEFTATIHGEQFMIEVKEQAGKPVATLYIFYESRGFRPMGQGTLQAMMNKAQRYAAQEAKDVDEIGRRLGFWASRPGAKGSSKAKA
jgi:hypothetical protein